ncbi:MAG: DUF58 domain-containing protein [Candidatus Omnitrophica bacterium]|jgi:uncharacterized protein (DUF58 family)|nr:DUF58 domain-containing protein [Candidatus Omnitrophota bacterium]
MIPKDIIKKIRKIQITTSRMADSDFAGRYHSVFKGRGMEFHEVREYIPGDEIRSIDWNVTARAGHPYVKKFVEERELVVMILLDVSMSCRFGTCANSKNQIAAEISSVLAFSAVKNNDKVGLILFSDKVEKTIPPRKGVKHILRIVREALYYQPVSTGTDLNKALMYLNKTLKRKAVVFVISDFFDRDFKKVLSVSNRHHDIVAVNIIDPREMEMPNAGIIKLRDSETGLELTVDTSSERFRSDYRDGCKNRLEQGKRLFISAGVDRILIRTDKPYAGELAEFFRARKRRLSWYG